MIEKTNVNWYSASDNFLLNIMGKFVQETRLQQNKTQLQIATAAGINRSTLSQVEKGNGGTLLTLVQILRALDQLSILKVFEVDKQISPLQLAALAQNKRKRARNKDSQNNDFKTSW